MTKEKDEKVKKVESYRWLVWSVLAALYVFVAFQRVAIGVVKTDLEEAFNIGAAQYANIGSMYLYAYFIMQIPSGILTDKFGSRKIASSFSILAALGSVLFGLAPNIIIAYLSRFIVGIGVSVVFICLIKIQSRWFYSRNFALMIGFVGISGNIGAILAQTPLVIAVNAFGWRNTFIYLGLTMVVFAILVALLVRDDPTDMGLPAIDELEGRPAVSSDIKVIEGLKSVMGNKKTWLISLAYTGLYTGYIVLLGTYGVSYLIILYEISKIRAANLIIIAIVGTMVGGLLIGYISDRIRKRKIVVVTFSIVVLICWIVFIYIKLSLILLAVFLFIMGFSLSSFSMCWTVANEVNDRRYSGIATSIVNCVGFAVAALVPVIMGRIIDSYKEQPLVGYQRAYLLLIILVAVSTFLTLFTGETNARNIYKAK